MTAQISITGRHFTAWGLCQELARLGEGLGESTRSVTKSGFSVIMGLPVERSWQVSKLILTGDGRDWWDDNRSCFGFLQNVC
jgi:hypothetical protein